MTKSRRVRRDRRIYFIALGVFVAVFLFTFLAKSFKNDGDTEAANLANFDPGYIISDYQMSRYNSMTEAEIQNFLKQKGNCDDTRTYLASYYTDYSYHIKDGHFVCLADETFGDGIDYGDAAPNGVSAAHIIWQAAQDYKINPQVLIVLLQKEQGLVTDSWPNNRQYRSATGYGCPDTAECDSKYYGFKNQVRKAAEMFRTVLDGGWTNYPLGNNYVQYNPNGGCGGSVVNIRSLATSSLYRYTPYQPNASALAAGYGTGDSCGAYGNRNFYLYFEDWFGGITAEIPSAANLLANMVKLPDEATVVDFEQNVFVQKYEWLGVTDGGKMVGTTGYNLRMEGLTFKLKEGLGIEYRSHLQDRGWETTMKKDGEISGLPGSGLRIEAIQLNLYGSLAEKYDIYYRAHVQDIGWMGWVSNGAVAGTTGRSLKIEALQVKIVEKPTYVGIEYYGHVQDYGWMSPVKNGGLAGTTGQSKRVEALVIKLEGSAAKNNIEYAVHVQDYGWLNPVESDGVAGTTGQAKRIEAITIKLKNGLENLYNIEYRVHVQDYGWMGWVSNGAVAGTTGQSKRVEAIEIKLVKR